MLTVLSDLLLALVIGSVVAVVGTTVHLFVRTLGEARDQAIEDDPARRAELVRRAAARRSS